MKRLKEDIAFFMQNKFYVVLLVLTAIGCYGYKMMHMTIGMDDTPYDYYFSDGLVVVVGRWVLFLLNRFLDIGDFAPFLTDFAAVLLLMVAAVLWSVVCKRIFDNAFPAWCYLVFSCLFISNPLICEVFTYFLHNGIAIGYTSSALAVLCFMEGLDGALDKESAVPVWKKMAPYMVSAIFAWIAIGCYESFAVVFMVMAIMVLFARRVTGLKDKPVRSVLTVGVILVVAIVLRSIMTNIMIATFSLQDLQDEAVQRSMTEMLSWITDAEGRAYLTMAIKRAIVMYGVFAYHYLPIFMYVLACVCFVVFALWKTIKRKDLWILIYMIGVFVASWILVFIEGSVTLYRSAQFLPLFSAFTFLLVFYGLRGLWKVEAGQENEAVQEEIQEEAQGKVTQRKVIPALKRVAAAICLILSFVAVWNQIADMNNWFYIDHAKYTHAKETMDDIALELKKNYDTSKPIVFIGQYEIPMSIVQDAYVPIGSETFYKMNRISYQIDPHLLEKFYRRNCVWVAQTPSFSILPWAQEAFGNNAQMIRFLEMHGHEFIGVSDLELIQMVEEECSDMPGWPKEGSIKDAGDYIVVSFGY